MLWLRTICLLVVMLWAIPGHTTSCMTIELDTPWVKRVIDGDTFIVYDFGVPPEARIRVLGVNTPERNEAGYYLAASFTFDWLQRGPFSVTTCAKDSFGRWLGTVTRGESTLANDLRAAGHSK